MLNLVGVWRFVVGYAVAEETGERIDLYGADPVGRAIFEPGGRMMAMLEARVAWPAAPQPKWRGYSAP